MVNVVNLYIIIMMPDEMRFTSSIPPFLLPTLRAAQPSRQLDSKLRTLIIHDQMSRVVNDDDLFGL